MRIGKRALSLVLGLVLITGSIAGFSLDIVANDANLTASVSILNKDSITAGNKKLTINGNITGVVSGSGIVAGSVIKLDFYKQNNTDSTKANNIPDITAIGNIAESAKEGVTSFIYTATADIKEEHRENSYELKTITVGENTPVSFDSSNKDNISFSVLRNGGQDSGNTGGGSSEDRINSPVLTISEAQFAGYTDTSITCVEGSTLEVSARITSDTSNTPIVVTALVDGRTAENMIKDESNNIYRYSFTVPDVKSNGDNYYNIVISAVQGSGSASRNLALTVSPKPVEDTLRITRELTSNNQVASSSGKVFVEGSTVKFTITSENPNIAFTEENISAEVSANNKAASTYVTLGLVKSGTYKYRRYEGTFTAAIPLASNYHYSITNSPFYYTVNGGVGGNVPAESIAFTTVSNKPYIKTDNLTATYTSYTNSNIGVSRSSLIVGNVITYEAQLDNYIDVNSVNLLFAEYSGRAGTISIPLTRVSSTGKFRGSYQITNSNIGYTYDLSKITYRTTANSTYYEMNSFPTTGFSFTVTNHQHTYGGSYQYNSDEHWQNSTCNDQHPGQTIAGNKAKHSFSSMIITPATQNTAGSMRYTCSVCGYTYTATIPSLGSALSSSIVETLAGTANGARVVVSFNNDSTAKLNSNVFTNLKGTTKELELQSTSGVSWIFKGQDITGTIKDIDISSTISSVQSNTSTNAANIRALVGNQPTVIIDFANNGTLPGKALVRVPLSTAMLGALGNNKTGLKVQYYNPSTKKLEDIANNVSVSTGNYVEFAITHNSSYIITKEGSQGAEGNTGNSGNTNTGNSGNSNNGNSGNSNNGNSNNTGNETSGNPGDSANSSTSSGNKKPNTSTTTTVIHKVVSPKTLDKNYTFLWIAMFAVGALLVISSICMTRFEEE